MSGPVRIHLLRPFHPTVHRPLRFRIDRWAAWAPGLSTQEQWLGWLAAPQPIESGAVAPLAAMPPMQRRRMDPLGRAALEAAFQVQPEPAGPVVFASRWAELARTEQLLGELARQEPLSPTQFGLSVHNAVGALFSIARGDRGNYLAVAAGKHSVEAGFVEALGLLADGAPRVMVVAYDGPPPALSASALRDDAPEPFIHAMACELSVSSSDSGGFTLTTAKAPSAQDEDLPDALQVLRFLVASDAPELLRGQDGRGWRWGRVHHA